MKAEVIQTIKKLGPGTFEATVVLNVDGDIYYDKTEIYEKTNQIYPTYKSLLKVISFLPRYGFFNFTYETNIFSIVDELNGNKNNNTKLASMVFERLEEHKVKIDEIICSA